MNDSKDIKISVEFCISDGKKALTKISFNQELEQIQVEGVLCLLKKGIERQSLDEIIVDNDLILSDAVESAIDQLKKNDQCNCFICQVNRGEIELTDEEKTELQALKKSVQEGKKVKPSNSLLQKIQQHDKNKEVTESLNKVKNPCYTF